MTEQQPSQPLNTVDMPLDEFLTTYAPAYFDHEDGTPRPWSDIVTEMMDSPADADVVTGLRHELRNSCGFREPIRVVEDDKTVGNGMHRVIALILERHPTVTVTRDFDEGDTPVLNVEFAISTTDGARPTDEQTDDLLSWLRSMPVQDTWVTSDSFSGNGTTWSGYYYCPLHLTEALRDAITNRISENTPLTLTVLSIEHDPDFGVLTEEEEAWFDRLKDA